MPLQKCKSNGIKWGKSGKCYTGKGKRKRALRQMRAIQARRKRY